MTNTDAIYAVIGVREGEGIITIQGSDGTTCPLVTMDAEFIPRLQELAQKISNQTGSNIELVKYINKDVLQRFKASVK